jgi:glycosyltransferase involved in cell wall biosynthesis
MGAGLPVVATRVGDVEKIIRDGHSGYLVSPEDSIELSSSMCNVLDNLPDLDALRQAAQKIVRDEYSVEAMVRYVEALYQDEAQRINL